MNLQAWRSVTYVHFIQLIIHANTLQIDCTVAARPLQTA